MLQIHYTKSSLDTNSGKSITLPSFQPISFKDSYISSHDLMVILEGIPVTTVIELN